MPSKIRLKKVSLLQEKKGAYLYFSKHSKSPLKKFGLLKFTFEILAFSNFLKPKSKLLLRDIFSLCLPMTIGMNSSFVNKIVFPKFYHLLNLIKRHQRLENHFRFCMAPCEGTYLPLLIR